MADKLSDKSTSQLNAMLNKGSGASQKEVRAAITELKKRGEDTPPPSLVMGGRREMSKGGKATKKVPVISIGIGMAEFPKGKKKAQMMRGGMANGKPHMYSNGGAVTDNAGLRALKASGPKGLEAYNKIKNS
jgi:hypothetical protein